MSQSLKTGPSKLPGFLGSRNGHLSIDRFDTLSLAEEHGTPLYVFSENRIADNVRVLRRAVESVHPRVKVCYASKANSNMAILDAVRKAGGDIEVNSGGELFKAKKVGFRPEQIVFNGVSKTDDEVREAISYGILAINVDSLQEIEQVARVAQSVSKRANISIRIVPEIITGSHIGLQTGLLSSKFGLSPSQIEEAFRRALASDAINLAGVHIHVGSQTPDAQPFALAFAEMWKFLTGLHQRTGHSLSHINVGGGLPVNYLADTPMAEAIDDRERQMLRAELDPQQVLMAALSEARVEDHAGLLEGLTIVFEPGRRIIGDAGLLLTRVCNTKHRPETGDTWLLTDAGYSLALSMAMYKWYYHLVSASRNDDPHATPYKVAGPLCDSGDVYFDLERGTRLPSYRLLPEQTGVGDLLALLNAGAYTLDQASQYNGRPIPAVVMITTSNKVKVIRRRETYEDLFSKDQW
jgi:D-ornithine/D-lysine decarboxylase